MRLSELSRRATAVVDHVEDREPADPISQRLRELGFVTGEEVRVVAVGPFGGDPLVVEQKIWPKLPHLTLTSPPLTCVVKDKPYAVAIHIKDKDGAVLQELKTTLISNQDQTDLPDAPLVTGSRYVLNPVLAGHPDGRLPNAPKPDCSKAG